MHLDHIVEIVTYLIHCLILIVSADIVVVEPLKLNILVVVGGKGIHVGPAYETKVCDGGRYLQSVNDVLEIILGTKVNGKAVTLWNLETESVNAVKGVILRIKLVLCAGNGCLDGTVGLYKPLIIVQLGIDLIYGDIGISDTLQELEAQTYGEAVTYLV